MRKYIKGFLFIVGIALIGNSVFSYVQSQKVNKKIIGTYTTHERVTYSKVLSPQEKAMGTAENANTLPINPDDIGVVGILKIPSIDLEYPIMKGKDNEYYLTHDPEENKSVYGAIFWDYKNRPLIFGHDMKDGAMFGNLDKVQINDEVIINDQAYTVQKTEIKPPDEVMDTQSLALVTCQGKKRLVVYLIDSFNK